MRVIAAIIGGLEALLGALLGLVWIIATIIFVLMAPSYRLDDFAVLVTGTSVGSLISCGRGVAGAGFAIGGRPRIGAWLMVTGAAGALVSSAEYIF